MSNEMVLTNYDIQMLAKLTVSNNVVLLAGNKNITLKVYPIPRGGIAAAFAIEAAYDGNFTYVENPEDAEIFIDDLVDSGGTRERYKKLNSSTPFITLLDKTEEDALKGKWIVFPWEVQNETTGPEDNIVRLLQYLGEQPDREGLSETPKRVLKAWKTWTEGYSQDPKEILKVFKDGAENYDQMVTVVDIPLYSKCEHHMADIFGTVTIAYIPNGSIVGLSKLSRLVNIFARRLQVQERLTAQIADSLVEHLEPLGVGVLIKARHMCMESRGICQQGHHTVTTALRGVIREQPAARAEFLAIAR